jgi:hypothetical protein
VVLHSKCCKTESWNGTSWTEVNDLNTAKKGISRSRNSNSSTLAFGGLDPPAVANTESWNGTAWTEVNDLNTARRYLGGAGTNTAALAFGGNNHLKLTSTEEWSGPSCTNSKYHSFLTLYK